MPKLASAYYKAYYELHELNWRVDAPVRIERADDDGLITGQYQVGHGPYRIPQLAKVDNVRTRAGDAVFVLDNSLFTLEGDTYCAIALAVDEAILDSSPPQWEEVRNLDEQADDAAAVIGLCLDQRFAARPISRHIERTELEVGKAPASFVLTGYPAAKASMSQRSTKALLRSLGRIADRRPDVHTLTALRWLEQSKRVTNGADRLVALWIAAEALMGGAQGHKGLVRKLASELALKKYKLGLSADEVIRVFGLDQMRKVRNQIIHEGLRPDWWPVDPGNEQRDLPQLLHEIVSTVIRNRLHATPTRAPREHVRRYRR